MADAGQLFARLAEDLEPRGAKRCKMFGEDRICLPSAVWAHWLPLAEAARAQPR
jgi:hypothetical protein